MARLQSVVQADLSPRAKASKASFHALRKAAGCNCVGVPIRPINGTGELMPGCPDALERGLPTRWPTACPSGGAVSARKPPFRRPQIFRTKLLSSRLVDPEDMFRIPRILITQARVFMGAIQPRFGSLQQVGLHVGYNEAATALHQITSCF